MQEPKKFVRYGLLIVVIASIFMGLLITTGSADSNNQKYFYGIVASSYTVPYGPCKFLPSSPGTITSFNAPTGTSISGATWVADATGNKWYAVDKLNGTLYTIDHTTGAMTTIGGGGEGLIGLAYDPVSKKMYGANYSHLYEIDITTGAQTLIGPFGVSGMIGIAFDGNGTLYGESVNTDSLYSINLSTGTATLIGLFGVNLVYDQDMACDIDNGILYLAACNASARCALYTCDVTTGTATKVGDFQDNSEIAGFAIPYGGMPAASAAVPLVTPTGLIALVSLLSAIAVVAIVRKRR
jgi:hypothetical protein